VARVDRAVLAFGVGQPGVAGTRGVERVVAIAADQPDLRALRAPRHLHRVVAVVSVEANLARFRRVEDAVEGPRPRRAVRSRHADRDFGVAVRAPDRLDALGRVREAHVHPAGEVLVVFRGHLGPRVPPRLQV
jgi:hypothetical protein